jgi:Na+/H+ antiporter NhaD/arsenite permease-like protein
MDTQQIIAIIIFAITMIAIMTEKVHRAIAAVAGVALLLIFRILSVDTFAGNVDYNTIGLLIGMMLFVAVVKASGLFEYIAIKAAKVSKGQPWIIMVMFFMITACLSAFLDNVTTVLLVGPMTIAVTEILEINPVPYLITQILASNIGGTATLVGDPPNIMIGSAADISFNDFLINTGVPAIIIGIITLIIFYFMYGRKLKVEPEKMAMVAMLDEKKAIKSKRLLIISLIVMALVVLAFIFHSELGVESSTIAITAAVLIMLISGEDAEEAIASVEWTTIVFFVGLFGVVGGLKETGVIDAMASWLLNVCGGNQVFMMLLILWVSAILSSFLDNIPFVATMIPLIISMGNSGVETAPLWWALSLGACLGGNGTLVGASANVVLSSIGKKSGNEITFGQYFKVGFPMMLMSVVISTIYLLIKF